MQHLKKKHSKGPDIGFRSIYAVEKGFGGHVGGRANACIFELRGASGGEAKVSDFSFSVVNEYVGSFDVSVYDVHGFKVKQALEDVFDECVGLMKILSFSKVSFLEQLG